MARRRVVVLGGGVAGVMVAERLVQHLSGEADLTLVARRAWGPIGPLLAPVAAGALDPRLATAPLRPRLSGARLAVATVTSVDPVSRLVLLEGDEVRAGFAPAQLGYDDVVLALGASPVHEALALPFAGVSSVAAVRDRLAQALAAASSEDSPRKRRLLTTVVVLGGSPAACSLAASTLLALRAATSDWPRLLPDEPRVVLVSPSGPLPGAPAARVESVTRALTALGVELRRGAVLSLAPDHLRLEGDERLEARTVIAADASRAPDCLGPVRDANGRVPVAATLQSATFPGVWALGACADLPAPVTTLDDLSAQADLIARNVAARARQGALVDRATSPRWHLLGLAPGVGVGSIGPVPVPSSIAWRLHLARELRRGWPTASPLLALAPSLPALSPALPASVAPAAPLLTPPPPVVAGSLGSIAATLPLPALPLGSITPEGVTTPGLPPFTLPLPPPPRRG